MRNEFTRMNERVVVSQVAGEKPLHTNFPVVPVADVPAFHDDLGPDKPIVLVVDDETIISFTLAAILNRSGFTALTARNGAEALELAALVPPDILVTDLAMQEMSGLDLALAVCRDIPDCEIILITGQISPAERNQEKRLSATGFVTLYKPVFPADLLACIERRLFLHGKRPAAIDTVSTDSPLHLPEELAARIRVPVSAPAKS